jgi:hypothetical protein
MRLTVLMCAPAVPRPNEYSFNKAAGLLVIDQPIGTGYSIVASVNDVPTDMQGKQLQQHSLTCSCTPMQVCITMPRQSW